MAVSKLCCIWFENINLLFNIVVLASVGRDGHDSAVLEDSAHPTEGIIASLERRDTGR